MKKSPSLPIPPSELPILFIIGAARSGTNFLARSLAQTGIFYNTLKNRYIWNFRQKTIKYDKRSSEEANSAIASYISNHFQRIATNTNAIPLDKTPSNAFRIPFIKKIFPNCKIINIIRDGRASVVSRKAL